MREIGLIIDSFTLMVAVSVKPFQVGNSPYLFIDNSEIATAEDPSARSLTLHSKRILNESLLRKRNKTHHISSSHTQEIRNLPRIQHFPHERHPLREPTLIEPLLLDPFANNFHVTPKALRSPHHA